MAKGRVPALYDAFILIRNETDSGTGVSSDVKDIVDSLSQEFTLFRTDSNLHSLQREELHEVVDRSRKLIVFLDERCSEGLRDIDSEYEGLFRSVCGRKRPEDILTVALDRSMFDSNTWHGFLKLFLGETQLVDLSSAEKKFESLQFLRTFIPNEVKENELDEVDGVDIDTIDCTLDDVLQFLDEYELNENVQWQSLRWLSNIEPDRKKKVTEVQKLLRQDIANGSGPDNIIRAVRNFDKNQKVNAYGFWALWHLARSDDTQNYLLSTGLAEVVIAALEYFKDDEVVSEHAMKMLWCLCNADKGQAILSEYGALDTILRCMERHENCPRVLQATIGTVWSICVHNEKNKNIFMQRNGVGMIVSAMERYPTCGALHDMACGSIWVLSFSDHIQQALIQSNIGKDILISMGCNPSNEEVQANACAALWNLAYNVHEYKRTLVKLFAWERITYAMSSFPTSVNVQENACGAIWCMADETTLDSLFSVDPGNAILNALFNHPWNRRVNKYGCAAIMTLSFDLKFRDSLMRLDAGSALIGAMNRHDSNEVILRYVTAALYNLSDGAANKLTLRNLDAIRSLDKAIKSVPLQSDVREYALQTRRRLLNPYYY